jgi:hypothetical protein
MIVMERKKGMEVEEEGNHWIKYYQLAASCTGYWRKSILSTLTVRGEIVSGAFLPWVWLTAGVMNSG